jgi:hypothetical protein
LYANIRDIPQLKTHCIHQLKALKENLAGIQNTYASQTNKSIEEFMNSQLAVKRMNENELRFFAQKLRQEVLEIKTHELYMKKVSD